MVEVTLRSLCLQERAPVHIVEESREGLGESLDGCGGEKIHCPDVARTPGRLSIINFQINKG
jgi:hypothetical protein